MSKPVIAFYSNSADDGSPPTWSDEHHKLAREQLLAILINKGTTPVVVYNKKENYLGDGEFLQYWLPELSESDNLIIYKKMNNRIKGNLLYCRTADFPNRDGVGRINTMPIPEICRDKYLSYLFAPDMHSHSYLLSNKEQLDVFWLSHSNKKVVLKALLSEGGEGVFIGTKSEYKDDFDFPILAQEFIDTSSGYQDLTSGKHDIRVTLFDGQPIYGLLREPPKSGDISNLMFGGSIQALYVSELPPKLIELTKELDRRFAVPAPRFFSADFGYNGHEWKLFELNSLTGLVHKSVVGPAADDYLEMLAEYLKKHAINFKKEQDKNG